MFDATRIQEDRMGLGLRMVNATDRVALRRCFLLLVGILLFTAVSGCSNLKASGNLFVQEACFKTYKYAVISPKTHPRARSAAANTLEGKGFTVYRSPVFSKAQLISSEIPVLKVECRDAGMALKQFGDWALTVDCVVYDLHSAKPVYEGSGEYMGMSVAEDFYGATAVALSGIPTVGRHGKSTLLVDLPLQAGATAPADRSSFRGSAHHQGTAWSIGGGYVATSYHVVADASRIELDLPDGKQLTARLLKKDPVNDIAILEVDGAELLPPALPLAAENESLGADVFTIGYPHASLMGTSPKVTSGKINATAGIRDDPRFYQISVPLQSGNSGGPLLNMNGEVVGIVTSKLHAVQIFEETGDLPQNVNYSVKGHYVRALIDSAADSFRADFSPAVSRPFEELANRVKRSVMIIRVI